MDHCPDVARREIDDLQDQGYDLGLDEIVWLASLGERVENPPGRVNPYISKSPIEAGNVKLHPMTVQASLFLDMLLEYDWLPESQYQDMLAFILANARTPGAFDELTTRDAVYNAVYQWRREVTATPAELAEGVNRQVDDDAPADVEDNRPKLDYEQYLAQVEAALGRDKSEWMTRPMSEATAVVSAAGMLYHGTDQESSKHESRQAMANLLKAVKQIKQARNDAEA